MLDQPHNPQQPSLNCEQQGWLWCFQQKLDQEDLLSSQKDILQKLEQLEKKDLEQDEKIILIFEYLKQLEQAKQDETEFKNRKRVGFKQ